MLYFVISYDNILCDITKTEFLMQPLDTSNSFTITIKVSRRWLLNSRLHFQHDREKLNPENANQPLDTSNSLAAREDEGKSLWEVSKATKKCPQEVSRDGTVQGGKTADSGRLQILKDFLFKSGRFGAVSGPGRPGADSGRFRTAPKEDLETIGTEDRDASPESRSQFPSP